MCDTAQLSSAFSHGDILCDIAYKNKMKTEEELMAFTALKALSEKTGKSLSALASQAGVAHTTITRQQGKVKYLNLTKIFQTAGYSSYEDFILEWKGENMKKLRKSEEAITDSLTYIFKVLIEKNIIKLTEVATQISRQHEFYQDSENEIARQVTARLAAFLDDESYGKGPRPVLPLALRSAHGSG